MHMLKERLAHVLAASPLIDADIVNIQLLDILQQLMVLDLCDLTECIAQHASAVVKHKDGFGIIRKKGCEFLRVILGGMRLEQVRPQVCEKSFSRFTMRKKREVRP